MQEQQISPEELVAVVHGLQARAGADAVTIALLEARCNRLAAELEAAKTTPCVTTVEGKP